MTSSATHDASEMLETLVRLEPHSPDYAIDVVDWTLKLTLARGASDVHFQPLEDGWEVLLRVDGVLSTIASLRSAQQADPVTRLMVLASLPTYRSGQPMEGRLNWKGAGDGVAMRLGVFPTIHGPRAVVRVLKTDDAFGDVRALGLSKQSTDTLTKCLRHTDGAILLSGPPGSGKTTTLYAALRQIARAQPRKAVMTIEDPVESMLPSVSQSELDPTAGMTLASALRSAVRQDAEVLLVSEIRDPETTQAALQAALTGHLVFSSIHSSDVPSTLRRLQQFGAPVHAIRSGVRAIVSQRLLRKLCKECSGQTGDCAVCLGTGFRGRFPIASAIRLDGTDPLGDALGDALERGQALLAMQTLVREHPQQDLGAMARSAIEDGLTTEQEVFRVLGSV